MKLVIDRFEGDFAVCEQENGEMINIKKSRISQTSAEGDVLYQSSDGHFTVDFLETEKRKKEIENLTADVWA